jgi:site-specific DNA recombinase
LNTTDYFVHFVSPLAEAGVVVDTVSEGLLEWDDEDVGKAVMHLLKSYKGFAETVDLARRTTKGLYTRARAGRLFVGPRPFALDYTRDQNGERTGYTPCPDEEVAALKKMFHWYAGGMSLADVAEELNKLGIRTRMGSEWDRKKVHAILTNSVYAGDYVFGRVARGKQFRVSGSEPSGHARRRKKSRDKKTKTDIQRNPESEWFVHKDTHPALVERDLYDKVQDQLKARQRHTSPSRAKGKHPLSGLLYCPACGHIMYGTTRQMKTRVPVYVCGSYVKSLGCEGYWVREDEALAAIATALRSVVDDEEQLGRVSAAARRLRSAQTDDAGTRIEELSQLVKRLDGQIQEATRRLARVPERLLDGLLKEIDKMEAERTKAQAQLDRANAPSTDDLGFDAIVSRVRQLVDIMQSGDADLVHNVVREAIERVDLNFRVVRLPKNNRFIWEAGTVRLRGSSEMSANGPGPPRRTGPPPV